MQSIEKAFYELKPFFCLALGIYALTREPSTFVIVCSLILLFAGTFVLRQRLKHRRGSPMEQIWYDAQPFLYLGIALYILLFQRASKIAAGSALILLFCGSVIITWRMKNR